MYKDIHYTDKEKAKIPHLTNISVCSNLNKKGRVIFTYFLGESDEFD